MKLSLKKYLTHSIRWFIPFVLIGAICLTFCIFDGADAKLSYIMVLNIIAFFCPAAYYLFLFFKFRKKTLNLSPVEGVVSNWKAGSHRYTGKIIVNVDGEEYSTSSYFSCEECKNLVGKTITYAIIDEVLFVYEIKK